MNLRNKVLSLILLALLFYWYYGVLEKRIQNDESRKMQKKILRVNNKERELFISTSVNKLDGKNAPLVIFLHGMDGAWPNKKQTKAQYDFINSLAWKKNFIAIFPKGSPNTCGDGSEKYYFYYCWDKKTDEDLKFINKLKEIMINQYKIDGSKSYLVGFSDGGYFIYDYINKGNNNFLGYGINSASNSLSKKLANIKISLSVGKKDKNEFEESIKTKNQITSLGYNSNDFQFIEHEGGHNISKKALETQIDFLLKN